MAIWGLIGISQFYTINPSWGLMGISGSHSTWDLPLIPINP